MRRRRAPSAYNEFISRELKRLKTEQGLDHKAAFKLAAGSEYLWLYIQGIVGSLPRQQLLLVWEALLSWLGAQHRLSALTHGNTGLSVALLMSGLDFALTAAQPAPATLCLADWVASGAKAAAAAQQQARDGLHLALAEGAYMSQLQQLLQEQAAQQGYYTTTEPLLLPMPTPTTTLPAAAAQQVGDMPPPAARASISGSDAANNQQPLAGTAAAPAPTAAANVSQEASAVPVSGTGGLTDSGSGQIASTVGAVLNSASSTQHYVQHTTTAVPGGMTLQQAWESLCRSKQGGGVETVVLAAGCYDASTADYSAAAHDSTTAAAPAGAARLPSPAEEGTASGEPGCAAQQGTSVLGGHTAAAAGGGRVTTNSLTAPSQAPLSTAAGHKEPVGHVAVPIGTTAAGAVAVDPAAAALIVSEGSSLASVSSVMTGGAGERVGVTVASPGNNSVSGAAASTAPSILRHRSAPITTGCHRGAGGGGG